MNLFKVQKISEQVLCPAYFLQTNFSNAVQALAGSSNAEYWWFSLIPKALIPDTSKDNSCEFTKFMSGAFTKSGRRLTADSLFHDKTYNFGDSNDSFIKTDRLKDY
jgi:hypothetical protein